MNQGIQRYIDTPNQYADGADAFSNYLKLVGETKTTAVFVLPDAGQNARILFHYDSLDGSVLNLPNNSQVDFTNVAEPIKYVVTIGGYSILNPWQLVAEQGEIRVFKRGN
jgi:hypothetical protein